MILKVSVSQLRFCKNAQLILLCQINAQVVIPAGKRVSSAMDGRLKPIHGAWIPAIQAGMTILEKIDHVI